MSAAKPKIGISSCLLGEQVRYDGRHTHEKHLTETLGELVEWVPVCPEVEVGMGVPREAINLVGSAAAPRLIGEPSGHDWTEAMRAYAEQRVRELAALGLSGYILKADSPSCGIKDIPVYPALGKAPAHTGRGMFAAILMDRLPKLPIEDEAQLRDPAILEHFIGRVFAYQALRKPI